MTDKYRVSAICTRCKKEVVIKVNTVSSNNDNQLILHCLRAHKWAKDGYFDGLCDYCSGAKEALKRKQREERDSFDNGEDLTQN